MKTWRTVSACTLSVAIIALVACGSGGSDSGTSGTDAGTSSSTSSGGSSSGGSSSGGSSSGTSGITDTGAPSAQCNDVVNDAPFIAQTKLAGAAPSAAGGAIAEGRYHLTAINVYTTNTISLTSRADTLVVTGNVFESVSTLEATGNVYRAKSSFTINGPELTGTFICYFPLVDASVVGMATQTFTATPTELRSYISLGGTSTTEYVYTKL